MHQNKKIRKDLDNKRIELISRRDRDWSDLKIDRYAGAPYINGKDASEFILKILGSDEPCFIGRLGETEIRTLMLFEKDYMRINSLRHASYDICVNAGFFPRRVFSIKQFCKLYYDCVCDMDYLGMLLWKDEEFLVSNNSNLKASFSAEVLDPVFMADNPWVEALEKRKVLVISPFSQSIKKQYERREEIFGKNILPEFDLRTVTAVQSIGGEGAEGFKNWFEALDYLKNEIDKQDFDIALLGCGAYGLPLCSHIKSMGKKAIYIGGALQLMFGIMGSRWNDREYVKRQINDKWIYPGKEERPQNFERVESGCYW